MPQLDFAAIKQAVTIDEVATYLDLVGKRHGDQVRCACPSCKSGGDRTLVITPTKGVFYCHNSKQGGDIFKLVMHIKGGSVREAAATLADHFRQAPKMVSATAPQSQRNGSERGDNRATSSQGDGPQEFNADAYQAKLDPDHEKIAHYGLNPQVLTQIGGYCKSGVLRDTLAICVRRSDGECIGYIGVPLQGAKFPKHFKLSFPHDNKG